MKGIVAIILIGVIIIIYPILIFRIHFTCRKIKKDCDKIIKSMGVKKESHPENQQYVDDVQRRRW